MKTQSQSTDTKIDIKNFIQDIVQPAQTSFKKALKKKFTDLELELKEKAVL